MFLTAANPGIKNGGFIMERKIDVYNILPKGTYPTTLYFDAGTSFNNVLNACVGSGVSFPLIAKPDIGERGLGVKKIKTEADLAAYAAAMPVGYLVQEYIPFANEAGIFYCRYPGAENGFISGIVFKEPVTVMGDGKASVRELVTREDRYLLQLEQIEVLNAARMDAILDAGETLELVPYGNHSRGSKFTDQSFRANQKLSETIGRICLQVPGFYYGRLDVRFESWELLAEGESYSIIELNGSGSEPTHIYDPGHSIFFAWREIARHWGILYKISNLNCRNGAKCLTLAEGNAEIKKFRAIDALLSARTW